MVPLADTVFHFDCHPGVKCFTLCCKNVDMTLYPYDIIRLKNALSLDSEEFLRRHTLLVNGDNIYFPTVKLKLLQNDSKACPFLATEGCSVYLDRPAACRTYPLERAVDRTPSKGKAEEFYFLTNHAYCLGHFEKKPFSVKSWLREQRLSDYNTMNDLWTEMDTLFQKNPWKGEGIAGEKQRLAFLVCYNIDGFRRFVEEHKLIGRFLLERDVKRRMATDDGELLKFGFEWLKLILSGASSLIKK